MTTATLNPITKLTFKKWHSEGNLLFLAAGHSKLTDLLQKLDNTTVDWQAQARNVALPTVDGRQHSVSMVSNGCDEFVLVLDDMQSSDYSRDYRRDTGKQHITVYLASNAPIGDN